MIVVELSLARAHALGDIVEREGADKYHEIELTTSADLSQVYAATDRRLYVIDREGGTECFKRAEREC